MKLRTFVFALAISASAIISFQDAIAAQASRVLTTHASYAAGSAPAKAIQQWLRDHPGFQEGRRIGDPEQFGAVSVTYRLTLPEAGTAYGLGVPTIHPCRFPEPVIAGIRSRSRRVPVVRSSKRGRMSGSATRTLVAGFWFPIRSTRRAAVRAAKASLTPCAAPPRACRHAAPPTPAPPALPA